MYAGTSKVTRGGQITIPLPLREKAGIDVGSEVTFLSDDEGIRLITRKELDAVFAEFRKTAKAKKLTRRKIIEDLKAIRAEMQAAR